MRESDAPTMNSFITRILVAAIAILAAFAIVVSLNAQQNASLWQQQSAAQLQLVQQLALHQPIAGARHGAVTSQVPQSVATSSPVTRTS